MKTKEKLCLFFASDYHFEMISLPYINKELKKDKNVVIISENDLNNTLNTVLDRVNLKPEDKERIVKIDWNNNDLNKIKEINNKETIIFIKGKENYINNINKDIDNLDFGKSTKIVNCYDINEVENNIKEIAKGYSEVLSTSGVEKLL